MILTCPNCASRFLLPARALAPSGRRVRCSSCSSRWFQLPDPDEILDDMEEKIRAISESAKPEIAPSPAEPVAAKRRRTDVQSGALKALRMLRRRAGGAIGIPYLSYGAAALVFLAILTVFVVLRPVIMKSWPASAVLYEMIGLPVEIPGEGVTFERISARSADEKSVEIEGQVINQTLKKQELPPIEATLEGKSGDPLARWIIDPPAPAAGAEAVLPFKTRYEGDARKAERLQLRFIMGHRIETKAQAEKNPEADEKTAKTASEDAGNTPAPPADGSGHPPGGAAH